MHPSQYASSMDHGSNENIVLPSSQVEYSISSSPKHDDKGLLDFAQHDRSNPLKWPKSKKILTLIGVYLTTFTVSLSSSIFTEAVPATSVQFHVSTEVMTLSVSLYVLGFAAGPLIWAPLSEAYGRRYPYLVSYFLFFLFHIPVAVAKNAATILVFRFLCGTCGSSTFAIPPAMSVDFLEAVARSKAVGLYMACVFMGTVLGPVVGAYTVGNQSLGWPWTAWLIVIISGAVFLYILFFIPETYAQILLQREARCLRAENIEAQSKRDVEPISWKSLMNTYMTRPLRMLLQEPILIAMTLYNCLIYGILYLAFFAYPYCFGKVRGWSESKASLPFLALLVGILLAIAGMGAFNNGWWTKRFLARGQKLLPEDRVPPMAVSAVLLPVALFWFAWTSNPHIHWAPQVISGVFLGAGIMLNLLSSTSYLIDVYLINSNSAMAANVCLRSISGAAFPLFANAMYQRLGQEWATSLLGFLCVAMAVIPWLFWKYGKALRDMSKFASK